MTREHQACAVCQEYQAKREHGSSLYSALAQTAADTVVLMSTMHIGARLSMLGLPPRMILSRAVLVPPSLNYKSVTSASCDCGNISHDHTRDSSCDPSTISCNRMACDPGKLRPHDPGKIAWDKMHFGHATDPLINMWQIVGMINKTHLLNNQQTRDMT